MANIITVVMCSKKDFKKKNLSKHKWSTRKEVNDAISIS